jgi:addiction module RelB/DinJ family antitoxin
MKTIINVKADKDVKEKAFKVSKELGLPLSTIINAFLKQFIREKTITFSSPLVPSKYLEKILIEADKDIKTGKNLIGPFADMKKLDKYLNSI